ncbi:MAG TPA: hypothetical protein VJX92_08270 [Methylomirabilota bacterium]|nr:hypothetical protein [Methylomirabilota bacterium]
MFTDRIIAFLIRCGAWALLAWAAWSHPIVRKQAHEYHTAWVAAWRIEPGDCDTQAYGLLFRRACEE